MSDLRMDYSTASNEVRAEAEAWVREHGLDPKRVPVDSLIEYDSATREWVIEVYAERDGRMYVGGNGNAQRTKVRCVAKSNPPFQLFRQAARAELLLDSAIPAPQPVERGTGSAEPPG